MKTDKGKVIDPRIVVKRIAINMSLEDRQDFIALLNKIKSYFTECIKETDWESRAISLHANAAVVAILKNEARGKCNLIGMEYQDYKTVTDRGHQ